MYESTCAFSSRGPIVCGKRCCGKCYVVKIVCGKRSDCMWKTVHRVNGAIYLIASYDIFVNRPSCYVINQQQLQ